MLSRNFFLWKNVFLFHMIGKKLCFPSHEKTIFWLRKVLKKKITSTMKIPIPFNSLFPLQMFTSFRFFFSVYLYTIMLSTDLLTFEIIFVLSPVYTMQVLHPSLHSSFLIVYTIQETWIKKLERTWME